MCSLDEPYFYVKNYIKFHPVQYLTTFDGFQISQWSLTEALKTQRKQNIYDSAIYRENQNQKLVTYHLTPYQLRKIIFIKGDTKLLNMVTS
jgi:hypothetical protein